jgi:LysR family transcriptional regulator (chromosome initiation inhibitor)
MGHRLCQHANRVHLLEQDLHKDMPSSLQDGNQRATLPIAVNADSLATWFMAASAEFAADSPILLQVAVDDEGHTAQWLRSGQVLAAVTAMESPAVGCNCLPLGKLRYVAAAQPAFIQRHFHRGVDATSLSCAPSLVFNSKDELQQRWVQHEYGQNIQMPQHTLPSPEAFVAAAIAGLGWAMHPELLVREHLEKGVLVELKPGHTLDVALYWQHARISSSLLDGLTSSVLKAARAGLAQ